MPGGPTWPVGSSRSKWRGGSSPFQGPKAWPVCSKHAGLTRRNGHATTAPLPRYVSYRVRPGDSLSMIAQRHHISGGWQELWRINRTNVPNPNVLFIGQMIQIPLAN